MSQSAKRQTNEIFDPINSVATSIETGSQLMRYITHIADGVKTVRISMHGEAQEISLQSTASELVRSTQVYTNQRRLFDHG